MVLKSITVSIKKYTSFCYDSKSALLMFLYTTRYKIKLPTTTKHVSDNYKNAKLFKHLL